jgi:hypothetical protein
MPTKPVYRKGKLIGYRWGKSGKLYLVSKYGKKKARNLANKQGQAIYASGYKSYRSHPTKLGSLWEGEKYIHGPRLKSPKKYSEFILGKKTKSGKRIVWGKVKGTNKWEQQSTLRPKQKRKRPRQHYRRVKTKKGYKRILINKGVRPKRKVKRSTVYPKYRPIKHKKKIMEMFDSGELSMGEQGSERGMKELFEKDKFGKFKNEIDRLITRDNKIVGFYASAQLPGMRENVRLIGPIVIKKSERRKGIGSQTIEDLFKYPKVDKLFGAAYVRAAPFWEKMGAKVDYDPHGGTDPGDYLPFILDKKDFQKKRKK